MPHAIGMCALSGHLTTGRISNSNIQFISLDTVGNDIKFMLNTQVSLSTFNAQCVHI